MDEQESIKFLFAIATEAKRSFETPVILVTLKDYAEGIYKSMQDMRSALVHAASPYQVADIITQVHFNWLEAVREVEALKKRIRDTPHDNMNKAIDFSIECVNKRNKQFHKYINRLIPFSNEEDYQLMQDHLKSMSEMCDNLVSSLRDKQKIFSTIVDPNEYYHKLLDETDELLNWLDTLYDNLATQFSKVTDLKLQPELTTDLTRTLQEIIDEVAASTDPEAKMIVKEFESKNRTLSAIIDRLGNNDLEITDDLEIQKIIKQIKDLHNRIEGFKNEDSSAVMALQHKTLYLEERLMSLENLRTSMFTLKNKSNVNQAQGHIHIFDHLLPLNERCRLVEDLVKLWTKAICGDQEGKSIISILSVGDIKEIFTDEFGKFSVDKYGRKLYMGDNNSAYQLNEINELVPLDDDENHVYYYDECGRYFYDDKQERIYKAHKTASEYIFDNEGLLLKLNEYRDSKVYWYDSLGRYFLNEKGKRIYCSSDGEIYENDGLGNLVRIRSVEDFNYEECILEPVVSEDSSKYLQMTVGPALKKCIAAVVIRQPSDPILFLANSLEDYRNSQEARQARLADEQELMVEREERMRDTYQALTEPASLYSGEGELPYADPNLFSYQTIESED